jgi:chlorobactene glucosyltransferase
MLIYLYQGVAILILVAILANTLVNFWWLRATGARSAAQPSPAHEPLVSILIPARNEARSIVGCVESLLGQTYPRCEIVVLDDHSEDETAALVSELAARHPTVRLLHGKPLLPGWHGKAYACAQLACAARGEWLLFVDADTVHAPDCVATALRAAEQQHADLVTMMPQLETGSFGEALLVPTIPIAFGSFLPLGLVMRHPAPLLAGALGQFLLFRRAMYEQIGGHASVRTDIVEDVQLSRLVKRQRGRVVWIDGTRLMRVRMYHGLREAWRGLAKSSFAAIDNSWLGLLIGLPLCAALFLVPYALLVAGLVTRQFSPVFFWLPLAQIALMIGTHWLLLARFRLPRRMALLYAGTILAIMLFTTYAAFRTTFGRGVAWKGRTYQFAPASATPHGPPSLATAQRLRLAAALSVVRLPVALGLVVLGWARGNAQPPIAVALLLTGWSLALVEYALRDHRLGAAGSLADALGGVASLAYLRLSGLLSIGVVLLALLIALVCVRLFRWQVAAAVASILLGSVLLVTVGVYAPTHNLLLLAWFAGLVLLSSRSAAHLLNQLNQWFQHLRSS